MSTRLALCRCSIKSLGVLETIFPQLLSDCPNEHPSHCQKRGVEFKGGSLVIGTAKNKSPESFWSQNRQKTQNGLSGPPGPECQESVEKVPKDPKKSQKGVSVRGLFRYFLGTPGKTFLRLLGILGLGDVETPVYGDCNRKGSLDDGSSNFSGYGGSGEHLALLLKHRTTRRPPRFWRFQQLWRFR